jgi:uncharacterized protein YjfI (DUF2170 family)
LKLESPAKVEIHVVSCEVHTELRVCILTTCRYWNLPLEIFDNSKGFKTETYIFKTQIQRERAKYEVFVLDFKVLMIPKSVVNAAFHAGRYHFIPPWLYLREIPPHLASNRLLT